MNIATILDLVADVVGDRTAVQDDERALSYSELRDLSEQFSARVRSAHVPAVAWLATSSTAFPVALFGAARAGVPFVPLNYRLSDEALLAQIARLGECLLVVDALSAVRVADVTASLVERESLVNPSAASAESEGAAASAVGSTDITEPIESGDAVWLFTSGTTGTPKISVLGHEHLSSYILSTVEMCGAESEEAILVSVPPYHVAGLATVLSSCFSARRMVYLPNFAPEEWIAVASREGITQAMVVPTMLQRILETLSPGVSDAAEHRPSDALPQLRSLSYGGGRMPRDVIEAALTVLPQVDFANAYGLTETSSTIALLGPDDIRTAFASTDPVVARRISSVGRPVPGIELRVVREDGHDAQVGETGEIWVRGPQVSGRYLGQESAAVDGWFATKDEGELDAEGYVYLHGRLDDVIVRGGENISPGEVEDVLREHPSVADVVLVSYPDNQWGEIPVAVIVDGPAAASDAELSDWVRAKLRSSRVPDRIVRLDELPYNEMGKVLRIPVRHRVAELLGG